LFWTLNSERSWSWLLFGVRKISTKMKHENTYVAESDAKVVGYMTFSKKVFEDEFSGKHFYLYHIVVKRKF